jgi:hypothetical protein
MSFPPDAGAECGFCGEFGCEPTRYTAADKLAMRRQSSQVGPTGPRLHEEWYERSFCQDCSDFTLQTLRKTLREPGTHSPFIGFLPMR